jgi:predicted RNA-binding protein with PUA-like domain
MAKRTTGGKVLPKASARAAGPTTAKAALETPTRSGAAAYWLLKSEPDAFSWEMQKARGKTGEPWSGVRNFQARNNMRAMHVGDLGFFYHSNIGKEIVGIVRVIKAAFPDPTDETGKWDCVQVEAVADVPKPVSLDEAKANPKLAKMMLVVNTRLSVQPVTAAEWAEVCRMGGLAAGSHLR